MSKYIRNQHRFMVFSDKCVHAEIASKALAGQIIHGAGFFDMSVVDGQILVNCFGDSKSLGKSVRRDDHSTMLNSLGIVVEGKETVPAKYVIFREKIVVFWHELEHEDVSAAAFFGSIDCDSAGFVTIELLNDGRIKIECFGEDASIGAKSKKGDNKKIAELYGFNHHMII